LPCQLIGLGDVSDISRCQREAKQPALAVRDGVDLGRPATARAANLLCFAPPFPPAADRCTLIDVLSIERVSFGTVRTNVSKMACQRPRRLQRLKRL